MGAAGSPPPRPAAARGACGGMGAHRETFFRQVGELFGSKSRTPAQRGAPLHRGKHGPAGSAVHGALLTASSSSPPSPAADRNLGHSRSLFSLKAFEAARAGAPQRGPPPAGG